MAMKPVKVSQLNGYIKRILQTDPILGNVSVIGEVSNLKFHSSGHVYFSLKDELGKINCFLPADRVNRLRFQLDDGMEITADGYIYLYEKGGAYSLNIRDIKVSGIGNLSIAFEKLKEKLSKEGLFDEQYKKTLPFFPRRIAVVTSETGAAVRDILKIIKNRNNIVDVLVYPVLVQGPNAAFEIAEAINRINLDFSDIDVIITGRGGGSMEELWAFNEEIVARAIFNSAIPVISAVGHEVDFTIADFVADKRAETPTAAAQMAVPDTNELKQYIIQLQSVLENKLSAVLRYKELQLQALSTSSMYNKLENKANMQIKNIEIQYKELFTGINNLIYNRSMRTENAMTQLNALNPQNVIKRGYSAVLDKEGRFVSSVDNLKIGEEFSTIMSDGRIYGTVTDIKKGI